MPGSNNIVAATSLTGAVYGSLDNIDGSLISDGDIAIVIEEGVGLYGFSLKSTSPVPASDPPNIIIPATNPGNLYWELAFMLSNDALSASWSGEFFKVPSLDTVYDSLLLFLERSCFTSNSIVVGDDSSPGEPDTITIASSSFVGRKATGGIVGMTVAEALILLNLTLTNPVAYTDDASLDAAICNGNLLAINEGASKDINLDLPPAVAGLAIKRSTVQEAYYLKQTANGTDVFRSGSTTSAAGSPSSYIRSNIPGTAWTLTCSVDGIWDVHDIVGILHYDE